MRSMCGADAGCLAINYQSLYIGGWEEAVGNTRQVQEEGVGIKSGEIGSLAPDGKRLAGRGAVMGQGSGLRVQDVALRWGV